MAGNPGDRNPERRDAGVTPRESTTSSTGVKEEILSAAESALINYLKQLNSLPSHTKKDDDPLNHILRQYARKWRGAEK